MTVFLGKQKVGIGVTRTVQSGSNYKNSYNENSTYSEGDIVKYNDHFFISKTNTNNNNTPILDSDTNYWADITNSNFYTKTEINNMIGDISNVLDNINGEVI